MNANCEARIVLASSQEIESVRHLWSEYWDSLGLPADFQDFAKERRSLPDAYGVPKGRLLLALVKGSPVGTAALRPLISGRSCEAKRLYVRPSYRGHGVGRALLSNLAQEARAEGYEEMYADTLESMAARRLYVQMGFSEVAPYSSNPTPGAIYLKLLL